MCYSALVKRSLKHLEDSFGAIEVRTDFSLYERNHQRDPKRFPPFEDRIFPGYYAPVVYEREGGRVISPMRYGAYPPPSVKNQNAYTTFNARRDNLTSNFWSMAFMRHHGVVVLEAFYEWVAVADLLKAKVVTLKDVTAEFERQKEERKAKILAAGKTYKPTATEMKDPMLRQIVIEFRPEDGSELYAPTIFSYADVGEEGARQMDAGFAIVTDDPPAEVVAAGHDRCPVILGADAVSDWLKIAGKNAKAFETILTQRRRTKFTHKVAEAA
jgi:putative SOS response-associated peptidase YedK